MTQEQALIEAKKMFPVGSVTVSRDRFIGYSNYSNYYIWKSDSHSGQSITGEIMGSSHDSWEDALIEARVKGERTVSPDIPFEDETEDAELESK